MKGQYRDDSFSRSYYLKRYNPTVLKMLHNKKYPLCPEKMNRVQKNKEKHQAQKLSTCPSEPQLFSCKKRTAPRASKYRSIGDHFQYQNLRHELQSKRASTELEQVNNKLNVYIWEKKKQIAQKYSSVVKRDQEQEFPQYLNDFKQFQKSEQQLPSILRDIRKHISNEGVIDAPQDLVLRRSDFFGKNFKKKLGDVSQRCERQNCSKWTQFLRSKNPKKTKIKKSDDGAILRKEMIEELKQHQPSDRFCRMRINLNHKKIVSLGCS